MYLSAPPRRRRALRGLRSVGDGIPGAITYATGVPPSIYSPSAPGVAPAAPTPLSTSGLVWNWLSSGFGVPQGCYPWDITCANRAAMIAAGQAQIQNVTDNASYYYGPNSPTAQVAQQVATQQSALVPGDVTTLTQNDQSLGPLSLPWWIWGVAAGVGIWAVMR